MWGGAQEGWRNERGKGSGLAWEAAAGWNGGEVNLGGEGVRIWEGLGEERVQELCVGPEGTEDSKVFVRGGTGWGSLTTFGSQPNWGNNEHPCALL